MSFKAAVLSVIASVALAGNLHDRAFYEAKFFNWLAEHNIKPVDGKQFVHFLQNFANNDDIIETHNANATTYTLGHNKFSHMSYEEWRAEMKFGLAPRPESGATSVLEAPSDISNLAASIDWVDAGAVTGVKDQGKCGSCWSFSTTGALEGAVKIKTGSLLSLSEQNFVDCDNFKNGGSDLGCNGGLMDNAFKWAQKNGGVCSEADYPYVSGGTQKAGTCSDSHCTKHAKPSGYVDVATNSDSALMAALNIGPVSVAIEADQAAFQLYKSGVFTAACGTSLDHGVLAVGYGTMNGVDYYRVKNSWGTEWGDKGYIYLQRGVSQKQGQCGILSGPPSYPTV